MKTPSEHIKFKAIAGYIALLGILLLTLLFIYRNVSLLTQVDDDVSLHTDSISSLVGQKDEKLIELIQSLSQLNSDLAISSQDVEKLLNSKHEPAVQKSIITKSDTVISKPKKKKFFKRIAEAISPSKMDSTVQIRTYVEMAVDTLNLEPNDSAKVVLQEIQKKIAQEKRAKYQRQRKANELQAMNQQISARIDSILTHYNEERVDDLFRKIEEGNKSRKSAVQWIGLVAVSAVILAVLFSILLLRDIDKRNRYRKALEESNKRAADLLNAREKLMLTITHDIKAPVGTIMGYSELFSKTNLTSEQKEYISSIDIATEHVYKLVYDLLDYHLLDLNKADIKPSIFNLYDFINEIYLSFLPQFEKKKLKLINHSQRENIDKHIESDPVRMKQILNNLISNAFKFTDQGSVELFVSLSSTEVVFKVKDTGRGMTEEEKNKIFKEFTRLASAQGKEGFGLGLSIVSKIISRMKGQIWVDSSIDEGTLFTVQLPISLKNKEEISQAENIIFPKSTRIALLDDDQIQLRLTSIMLKKHGAEVVSCNHINQLLDVLKKQKFDLLITDIQMPEMSGFDLVELLRNSNYEDFKSIPVLAVSARDQIDEEKMISHGFIGVLKKPFNAVEVILKYNQFISKEVSQNIRPIESVYPELPNSDAIFNIAELTTFVQGDVDAMISILKSFVEEATINKEELKKAANEEDLIRVGAICHKIYPLVKMLSSRELSDSIHSLDQKEPAYTTEQCQILVKKIGIQIEELINAIYDYINSPK